MAFRSSLGPTLFADSQNQVVASAHHTDLGDGSAAMRSMPASFMVFTDKTTTKDRRADEVYNCFAHTGSAKTSDPYQDVALLGVCSDTTPHSKSKHSRVGVTVSGAVPVVIDRNDLKGLHPGDLLDYRFEMAPIEFNGLPTDFRTARVKKRSARIGPILSHHSIHSLRAMLDKHDDKRALAESVLTALGVSGGIETFYQSRLCRQPPRSNASIDWIRDMMGPALFGPTNFDHWWSLHQVIEDDEGTKVLARTTATTPYMGWLADIITPKEKPDYEWYANMTNEENWSTMADMSKQFDNEGTVHLVPYNANALRQFENLDEIDVLMEVLGFDNEPDATKIMLSSLVCDGKCGPLGKLVEVSSHSDEAVVLLENPVLREPEKFKDIESFSNSAYGFQPSKEGSVLDKAVKSAQDFINKSEDRALNYDAIRERTDLKISEIEDYLKQPDNFSKQYPFSQREGLNKSSDNSKETFGYIGNPFFSGTAAGKAIKKKSLKRAAKIKAQAEE